MSMRIVPEANKPTVHTTTTSSAPSAPGVHDTLRHGIAPSAYDAAASVPASSHPLETRLKNWEATQDALRMNTLRKTYGLAEPVRRGMELKIVRDGEWRPMALQQSGGGGALPSVHEDILKGRDDMIDWEDVFTGDGSVQAPAVHDEMEKKLKI